ncbi:cellulase family glycosylhydrolase [Saccharibacillus sp. CPCC 101409]|uniref:cellulase family glycosylhydrolase n=1 Tax=Saccharibacillus sp. CPCC 101409 TaxID=3058041 RepID=UPI0026736943|nr:cellulase family glycosylhydrolase [Saccharibacillus sp. CPCC 101409]MDO3408166.1 cellulase family glycosylhydrolase [Saccharibacillus sp. CPCC 101409]
MRKRFVKSFGMLMMVAVLLVSVLPGSKTVLAAAPVSATQSYVEAMQPGWNLGNSLDSVGSDETAWGNPRVTKELIQGIAAQGYKSIRIPVTWDSHIGGAPNYTIDAAYLNRVKEVTQWALDANLYVMINVHHDSWVWISKMENNHDQTLARYNAVWTQIANAFKNISNKLMFESVNEPRFTDGGTTDEAKQQALLDELNNSFHSIVRSSGGGNAARPLVISTLEASPTQTRMTATYNNISKWNDKNVIATVHYYGFWPFSVNIAGYTTFNQEVQSDITTTFDNVYNTFVAKGIPVIVGEYGLLGFDKNTGVIEQGEKLKFFEYIGYYLKQKQITSMLWDNGQHFSRTQYKWADTDLFNIMKASWSGRSATASSDLVYVKKGVSAADKSVTLNLNGRTLSSLTVNGTTLKSGTDYTLSGSTLTFKASRLTQLTSSGTLGKSAVITAKFNGGADWKFNVVLYQTPKLSNTTGSTSSFSIPTAFNGDQLATMEAVYANGGNAGPQNWTSYKEFETAFSPTSNSIKLQPAFFNETNDGTVKLTFYFWSGEKVTYTIVKNGSNVTGTAS